MVVYWPVKPRHIANVSCKIFQRTMAKSEKQQTRTTDAIIPTPGGKELKWYASGCNRSLMNLGWLEAISHPWSVLFFLCKPFPDWKKKINVLLPKIPDNFIGPARLESLRCSGDHYKWTSQMRPPKNEDNCTERSKALRKGFSEPCLHRNLTALLSLFTIINVYAAQK